MRKERRWACSLREQVGSEEEMNPAYLRKERRPKCPGCCGQGESSLGDTGESRKATAGYWREMESYSRCHGDPFKGFKPESRSRFIYLEGHFGRWKREEKATWISVNSFLLYRSVQTQCVGWLDWCGSQGKWKWVKAWSLMHREAIPSSSTWWGGKYLSDEDTAITPRPACNWADPTFTRTKFVCGCLSRSSLWLHVFFMTFFP